MVLFATALDDVVLYLIVPDALMCYRCGAMYQGDVDSWPSHSAFDLETHERHRQLTARYSRAQAIDPSGGREDRGRGR